MALRDTYRTALDAKLIEARDAGATWVTVTNLTVITTAMTNAAAQGKVSFTVTLPVTYQASDLRLNGKLLDAFKTGIYAALSAQNIMRNEVVANLNLGDQLTTQMDLVFSM
jgi:hypothetical protein